MTDSKLLDSTVWIDYLIKKVHMNIIDSEEKLYLSDIDLYGKWQKIYKEKYPIKVSTIGLVGTRGISI